MKRVMLALTCIFLAAVVSEAQYTPWLYWTFLPKEQMDEIVGEASGEAAWRTIAASNAFNRDRSAAEFKGTFFETQFVVDALKSYGSEKVDVFTYPGGEAWDGIKGELWEVSPIQNLPTRFRCEALDKLNEALNKEFDGRFPECVEPTIVDDENKNLGH